MDGIQNWLENMQNVKNEFKKAFLDTLPVMSGYLVLGIGFGMILQSKGYGVGYAACMSIFIYAGSMQYVGIDLLVSGASLITAALTTLLVNARHLFYGISMVDKYKNVKYKNVLVFLLTDETYSLVCTDEEKSHTYYMLVSLLDYSYWVSGSILGSVLGNIIPFSTEGIDFALTALFITVFVEQWLNHKDHIPAIVGVVSSVGCLMVFGADSFLIPTMIVITILLLVYKKWGNAHE